MEALWGCNMQIGMSPTEGVLEAMESIVWTLFVLWGGGGSIHSFWRCFSQFWGPYVWGEFGTLSEGFSKINIGGSIFMLELTATLGILPIYQNCSTNINWAWRTNFCKVTYQDHCHNYWCSDFSAHNIQPERTESSFILYLRLMFTFSIDVNFPAIALLLAAASEMMSRGGV